MPKRMIIDASHREETRVVVLDGQKVEEFDFEAASKRPLKGNIYLAKVTRVEPSLQAAFVEYGGNRQGFLAFAEIHPDYYQIPIADRMALLAEQEAEARRRADDDIEAVETTMVPAQESAAETAASVQDDTAQAEAFSADEARDTGSGASAESGAGDLDDQPDTAAIAEFEASGAVDGSEGPETSGNGDANLHDGESDPMAAEAPAQSKLQAPRPTQRWARKRHYKIQEVIKRRQVILVQVVKEERGNKGAALTTYLSLAGRYCVLMPNTPRGGGISRKITSATDRNRLKSAAQSLELPEGMGLIIRTAGENRTKAEIKRDYEYLLRMWDTIRELTLKSNAPACVYEEGDLIKRAIRDLYNKDVSEIVVEGDEGYRNAKDFMRMLMPSHAKNVKPYKEAVPLFQRYQIEAQLDAMFTPSVTLKSGGYIVINQTEALVSIDVNSGRATREHSIEDTAHKTNLEAAEEIARQLRLRDLAGLIVIDFIDMEDDRNDRNVEKRLRDCIKNDRARVQIGKISQFGLLEMSRQRLRAGVVAGSTVPCPHCGGQGIVRSVESTALRVLRGLEEEAQRQRAAILAVRAPTEVTIYALNQKRREIARIESEYTLSIQFEARETMLAGTFEIERIGQRLDDRPKIPPILQVVVPATAETVVDEIEQPEADQAESSAVQTAEGAPAANGKRRRRRRRGRDRDRPAGSPSGTGVRPAPVPPAEPPAQIAEMPPAAAPAASQARDATTGGEGTSGRKRRRRRRGRRGSGSGIATPPSSASDENRSASPALAAEQPERSEQPGPVPEIAVTAVMPNSPSEPVWSLSPIEERADRGDMRRAEPVETFEPPPAENLTASSPANGGDQSQSARAEPLEPQRKGWWQRPFRLRE
ncbi:MAG TPA: Rne/Rng family ribonuclease [Rhizomicrobium sp.]